MESTRLGSWGPDAGLCVQGRECGGVVEVELKGPGSVLGARSVGLEE